MGDCDYFNGHFHDYVVYYTMAKKMKTPEKEPDAIDEILALVADGTLKPEQAKSLIDKIKKDKKIQTIFNVSDNSDSSRYAKHNFQNTYAKMNSGGGCLY